MTDRAGQQLGNYRLTRLLGRGGFAEVYLGEHLRLGTPAAIKVLHTSLEDDDAEGFTREAQMVARLRHPHIVRVFDFDVENHTPFLVMDYLPNGNVRRSYPKGMSLPFPTIVSFVTQVASALQYAHDEMLIHRDIKPENMLLDRDNTLVLSDFGIALMSQSSRYQSTKEIAGTAAYMAPEQFQGHPRRASDQYALAVVVYEWLTGDRPFHGSFSEIASQHLFVPPPPLCEKVPMISLEVEQVVLTALAKDSAARFANVQAFATALQAAADLPQDSRSAKTNGISNAGPASSATASPMDGANLLNQTKGQGISAIPLFPHPRIEEEQSSDAEAEHLPRIEEAHLGHVRISSGPESTPDFTVFNPTPPPPIPQPLRLSEAPTVPLASTNIPSVTSLVSQSYVHLPISSFWPIISGAAIFIFMISLLFVDYTPWISAIAVFFVLVSIICWTFENPTASRKVVFIEYEYDLQGNRTIHERL